MYEWFCSSCLKFIRTYFISWYSLLYHLSINQVTWAGVETHRLPVPPTWGAVSSEPQGIDCESESVSHSVLSDSLQSHGLSPTRLFCPWNSPGKNTGVGCRFLLQGIFPTWGSNPGLLYLLLSRQILSRWAIGEARLSSERSNIVSLGITSYSAIHPIFLKFFASESAVLYILQSSPHLPPQPQAYPLLNSVYFTCQFLLGFLKDLYFPWQTLHLFIFFIRL